MAGMWQPHGHQYTLQHLQQRALSYFDHDSSESTQAQINAASAMTEHYKSFVAIRNGYHTLDSTQMSEFHFRYRQSVLHG
jgi:hypothetical protein